jgi:arginine-tRNA-protein transferase
MLSLLKMSGRDVQPDQGRAAEAIATFSYFPAIPSPVKVRLTTLPEHPCPYLPGRVAQSRAVYPARVEPGLYHAFMDAGFRRSGRLIYQPVCRGCRACQSIRVPVETFSPDKSQRRCWRMNQDLRVEQGPPSPTDESFMVYQRYTSQWHAAQAESPTAARSAFEQFLYDSPVETTEFRYRDDKGNLLAVGICDVSANSLSSVYFYFDPAASARSLGTFGALFEIAYARARKIAYYYLGFWIFDCPTMHYKERFGPHEFLHPDGIWRAAAVPRLASLSEEEQF